MHDPAVLMQLMRHEGWHAAQDCMAGTIENSMIAIIKPEEDVPMIWKVLAERTIPPICAVGSGSRLGRTH